MIAIFTTVGIVLSVLFRGRSNVPPFEVYRAMRLINPSPYMFYFNFGQLGFQIIGASPEMHVRLEDGVASVRPIAGTRRRGYTEEEDRELEAELLADPKERAEHAMLVDLGRNDVGRVAAPGTVRLVREMDVERYSHVMHMVSGVHGVLLPEADAFDLFAASFPAGTVVGAPKIRAMEVIAELERSAAAGLPWYQEPEAEPDAGGSVGD